MGDRKGRRMARLSPKEQKEWTSLRAKSKRHGIPIKRASLRNSNVDFGGGVYAQLGTGRATMIMDAKIKVKKKRK